MNHDVLLVDEKIKWLADILANSDVPQESEKLETGAIEWSHGTDALANAYFAIIGICHQTSPIGEKVLKGDINGIEMVGWDYLKSRYLLAAESNPDWHTPASWATLTAGALASLFSDKTAGFTLSRIAERAYLLNDIGRHIKSMNSTGVRQIFDDCEKALSGNHGFFSKIKAMDAYSDPLGKKSNLFISIAINECGWSPVDVESHVSPVDYHEIRGHLRLGTVRASNATLKEKITLGLVLTREEDLELRGAVQRANSAIAKAAGISASRLHYLLWNVLRACCLRDSSQAHCQSCGSGCKLPDRYRDMQLYHGRCMFADQCDSRILTSKLLDPPYMGHFY